jgi:hypothetical protein
VLAGERIALARHVYEQATKLFDFTARRVDHATALTRSITDANTNPCAM